MNKEKTSCVQPAGGPLEAASEEETSQTSQKQEKEREMGVMVGKPAPDFEAIAFHQGAFKNIKLSSFKGQWVVLCFYPGDFTFV